MVYKHLQDVTAFLAGDATHIREVLHPDKESVDINYSLAFATLEPGMASLPHVIQGSVEVYIITEGHGTAFIGGEERVLLPGVVLAIPAGVEQFVRNEGSGPLRFWCIVSPPWRAENESVSPVIE
jgi:mannose-6-phosphate isomerase-like protein (cupin superfamily)